MSDGHQIRRINVANEGIRRDQKNSRIRGEQILSSKDAFFWPDQCAKLGLNCSQRIMKGLGGSNPPLSATQSTISAFSAENLKTVRMFAHFLLSKGTGEAQIRTPATDSRPILSVGNRLGAPS